MKVPSENAVFEQMIKGSRFLSELFCVTSQNEAREKIKEQKKKYSDATHVCHAFIIGSKAEIMGMSDDGEPSGTAGRPMLDVLKGSGLTNSLITITRWFGGTLLGTGGLVKAYGDGAKSVILGAKTEELVEKTAFKIECGYAELSFVKKIAEQFEASKISENFGESVCVLGKIASEQFEQFALAIYDKSNGIIKAEKM